MLEWMVCPDRQAGRQARFSSALHKNFVLQCVWYTQKNKTYYLGARHHAIATPVRAAAWVSHDGIVEDIVVDGARAVQDRAQHDGLELPRPLRELLKYPVYRHKGNQAHAASIPFF
jgi:hypothetical protein